MGVLSIIKNTPKAIVKVAGKIMTKVHVHEPQLLVYGGVLIAATGFTLGIVNAIKVNDVKFKSEAKTADIDARKEDAQKRTDLTEEERTAIIVTCDRELKQEQKDIAIEMAKLIGIPVLLFLSGMGMCVGGHRILIRRFGEVSSAFATLQQTFERYRRMNIQEHGEECDRRYRYGIVGEETTTATITDEKGKTKSVKCKIPVVDPEQSASMYSFVFSEEFSWKCPKDPVSTISYLRNQEKFWNTWMSGKNKPVTLYMVLEELGIELDSDDPRNDYIMIAGWRPNGDGDNHIDFGIMRAINKPALGMEENVVFLNFNCDGNLYHSTRYDKDGRKIC